MLRFPAVLGSLNGLSHQPCDGNSLPTDLIKVFLAAMTPIGELRLSIPLGIWVLDLGWQRVLVVSLLGNMAPVFPLLFGLRWASGIAAKIPGPLGRLWVWRTEKIRSAHAAKIDRFGPLALVFIVGIPLPMTGAWTGSIIASLFEIPMRRAAVAIALGVLTAGILVTIVVMAGLQVGVILAR